MSGPYFVIGAAAELVDAIRALAAAAIGRTSNPPTDDTEDDKR